VGLIIITDSVVPQERTLTVTKPRRSKIAHTLSADAIPGHLRRFRISGV